jgi:2-oxoglutarate/2-oxoacid ferredoxin oxidoreductase subunit beta
MQEKLFETYLVDGVKFPFCKGCGHTHSVRYLDKALTLLQRHPSKVNLVSDIGCIGLVDALFSDIHTVHTTHGRSTAFGTGIELTDSILYDSDLKTIVILGDGGATIGLLHIVQAALLNVDITVILCNNYLYGMTGGQHSAFTPFEMVTTTTPSGSIVPPMDICKLAESCEGGFIARMLATDNNLPEILAQAIDYPGFALVEILEMCPEYSLKHGGIDGKKLKEIVQRENKQLGVLVNRRDREEFSSLYKKSIDNDSFAAFQEKIDRSIKQEFTSSLGKEIGLVIAGTAGERVQLSSFILLNAAIASGLHATQKNDNPVTQGSGFSLSEVILSPLDIYYTGIENPQYVVVTSADGLREITANGLLSRCSDETFLFVDSSLHIADTNGKIVKLPLRQSFGPDRAAVGGVGIFIWVSGFIPREAFEREIKKRFPKESQKIISTIYALTNTIIN